MTTRPAVARKPKLNKDLLKQILRHISKVPERFDMGVFSRDVEEEGFYAGNNKPVCGTQACIGGWAVLLDAGTTARTWKKIMRQDAEYEWHDEAKKLLGLTEEEAQTLFYWDGTAPRAGTPELIEAAKERIKLLIKDREEFVEVFAIPS